jgi:hypothetical protein
MKKLHTFASEGTRPGDTPLPGVTVPSCNEAPAFNIVSVYRAEMLSFHRLSILERAADHKYIIIAACQKSTKCGRVFQA